MSLGRGLGRHQDVDLSVLHGLDQGARDTGVRCRVAAEHRRARLREQLAHLLLDPLDTGPDRDQRKSSAPHDGQALGRIIENRNVTKPSRPV